MTARVLTPGLLAIAALAITAGSARADRANRLLPHDYTPPELVAIEIEDHRGTQLSADLPLVTHDGRQVVLGDYFDKDGGKPTLLVLAYYRCPSLCTTVLNGVLAGMKKIDFQLGRDYRALVVSIDPRDTALLAAGKRAAYVEAYERPVGAGDWDFAIGREHDVKALADAVGFRYRWDAAADQYAHAAGAFVITPKGVLSNTLYGIEFPPRDLKFALMEASAGKLGSAWDKVLLRCFHWDPNARGYRLAGLMLMKLGGLIMVVVLTVLLLTLRRSDRRRQRRSTPTEPVNVPLRP